jgi:hypothetical protein
VDPTVIRGLEGPLAIVCTFGMPALIVFLVQHFKYRNRELEAELEARRMLNDRDKAELSARIERLENVILGGARVPAQVAPPAALPSPLPDFPEAAQSEEQLAARRARER